MTIRDLFAVLVFVLPLALISCAFLALAHYVTSPLFEWIAVVVAVLAIGLAGYLVALYCAVRTALRAAEDSRSHSDFRLTAGRPLP